MKIKIKSKTKKGKFIYGDFFEKKNSRMTMVFLSGFSGSKEFLLFKHASDFFLKNNFNTIRFNFCSDADDSLQKTDALKLQQMSFSVYIKELKNILDSFSKKSKKIILVGHSFGAVVSIIFLNKYRKHLKNIDLVLWDPSLLPWHKKDIEGIFSYKSGFYYMKDRNEILNKIFYKECITTNTAKIFHSLHKKACVIAAKNSADKDAKKYIRHPIIIANTNHFFDERKSQKELFKKTLNFLKWDL